MASARRADTWRTTSDAALRRSTIGPYRRLTVSTSSASFTLPGYRTAGPPKCHCRVCGAADAGECILRSRERDARR